MGELSGGCCRQRVCGESCCGLCCDDGRPARAGKYRTAAVTDEGDIYMWEGWSKPAEAGAPNPSPNPAAAAQGLNPQRSADAHLVAS